jgi:phospholipid/cholesterol/gamma-HCH transport system substrate-binding protein
MTTPTATITATASQRKLRRIQLARGGNGISFRERSPVRIGLVGLLVTAVLLVVLFNVHAVLARVNSYQLEAMFTEAGNLQAGNDVRLAGRPIGTVTAVELDGAAVLVTMNIDRGIALRGQTTAQAKTATALGVKYVALQPAGTGVLKSGDRIPLSRTRSAYDVTDALQELTATAQGVDTKQLAALLDEATATFSKTPEELSRALAGVRGLSTAIAERDAELQQMFRSAAVVSKVLDERRTQVQRLLTDGNQLAIQLTVQRISIEKMIYNLNRVTGQLKLLVELGRTRLRPALVELNRLLDLLIKNRKNLQAMLSSLAPIARGLAESVAGGPFFTSYVANFTPDGFPLFPDQG